MEKVIGIILIIIISLVILTGCTSNAVTESRFIRERLEIGGNESCIIIDTATKVQYIYKSGYGGGLTLLVDAEGKPLLYQGD